jgi:PAS domain S-box-containing protein
MSPTLLSAPDDRSVDLDRVLVSALLESIPHFVFFKDRRSRYLAVSRSLARYLGVSSPTKVIGRTDFDFFAPEHARPAYEDEQTIIRTGEPMLGKFEREVWPDGRVTWVHTSKLPLRDEHGEIIGTFGVSKDVTRTREIELELAKAQRDLVDASRVAGMAEVATGVLHNVGNVLNSLNVSASVLVSGMRQSKGESLAKLAALLREHQASLGDFLTNDPKGKRVPEFIASLARHAVAERKRLLQEIASLQKNVDHIKEIVSMQQAYATMVGVLEPLDPAMLMEDALRMNAGALVRHEVRVERKFQFVPPVLAEKAKVLQILINLIRNAKYACDDGGSPDKLITLRIEPASEARVRLIVQDNGVGIPAANLTRIFVHGFTTRATGHGFGLHSAANSAREMKGSLLVHSDGPGQGATFTLELPAAPPTCPTA